MSDKNQGHYCLDWDLDWITNKDPHFSTCTCFPVRDPEEIKAELVVLAELQQEYGIKK